MALELEILKEKKGEEKNTLKANTAVDTKQS